MGKRVALRTCTESCVCRVGEGFPFPHAAEDSPIGPGSAALGPSATKLPQIMPPRFYPSFSQPHPSEDLGPPSPWPEMLSTAMAAAAPVKRLMTSRTLPLTSQEPRRPCCLKLTGSLLTPTHTETPGTTYLGTHRLSLRQKERNRKAECDQHNSP